MNKPETKAETQRTQEEQTLDWETDTGNADKLTKREGKTKTNLQGLINRWNAGEHRKQEGKGQKQEVKLKLLKEKLSS